MRADGTEVVEADLTWVDGAFVPGVRVALGSDGRIAGVGPQAGSPTRRLARRALLPGMVNAHSHAFQRGLRGRGERFAGDGDDFWDWRAEMYALVESLDAQGLYRLSRQAFDEMRRAGITTVGEFHYLHHADPDAADGSFDDVVLEAAAASGVRLVLLDAYYRTGGPGRPLAGAQRRFSTASPEAYWRRHERLAGRLDPSTQSLGAVVHSLRAADPGEIAGLWAEAARRGLVFHMHVEEQQREIDECVRAWGARPLELLLERLDPDERFTAVHCTRSRPAELTRLVGRGARVCICPLTEANLGDGLAELAPLAGASGGLCLGTDSNARISLAEEMRWLEYGQRLARRRRGVLRDAGGATAPRLFAAATTGGAASLGVRTGRIATGYAADLFCLDLDDPSLAGCGPDELLAAFVFGGADTAVRETAVHGRWAG